MKRKRILQTLCLVLTAALTAAALIPFERSVSDNSRWMAELSDDTVLNTMTIPGTHDSGAL